MVVLLAFEAALKTRSVSLTVSSLGRRQLV